MKMKRVLALALALLLFVGDVLPVVTAVGGSETPTAPAQVVYNFNLKDHTANLADGNLSLEDAANVGYLENLYNTDAINWLYEGKTNGNSKADGSGVETQHSRNQHYSGGIRLYSAGHGWWYAIRIKSPGTGTYQVTVNSDTAVSGGVTKHSIWTETYLFDAAGVDAGTATINDGLTEANKMNDFTPTATETDVVLGKYDFEAGKEYLLVFNETYAIYSAGRDGFDTSNLYFKSLTLDWQTPSEAPAVTEKYYDFGLPALNVGIVSGNNSSFSVDDQKDAVKALYDAGTIDWAYEGRTDGNAKSDNSGEVRTPRANTYAKSNFYKNGYGLYLKDHASTSYNGYYAIRLRAPGVGEYSITVNSAMPPENGGSLHSRWTDTYVFDASLLNGTNSVADFLTDTYKKNMFAPTVDAPDSQIGTVTFTSTAQEYILVFHLTIGARNSANRNTYTEHLALNGLTLKYIEPTPEESTTQAPSTEATTEAPSTEATTTGPVDITGPVKGYSFNIWSDYSDYLATGNYNVDDSADALTEMYEKGLIEWLPAGYGGLDAGTSPIIQNQLSGDRLQVYSVGHNWYYAIRFRAPGTGTYDFTVNTTTVTSGGVQKHSIWTEAYVAEADTFSNVSDILNDTYRVKGFKPTSDAPDAYIGNMAFDETKEYVLILRETIDTRREAHKDGLSTDNLYLTGFTFQEADPPEVPKTGYDFNLTGNYPDDFIGGTFSVDDQKNKINTFFQNGSIDWAFEGYGYLSDDTRSKITRNELNGGVRVYSAYHDWYYAIRFRSHITGTADVTVNTFLADGKDADGNPIKKHSIWTNAYIVAADDFTTVEAALTEDNKVKRFAPTSDDPDAYIGNVTLKKGAEYIIILRETSTTRNDGHRDGLSTDNLYLKGLTVEAAAPPAVEKTGYDFDLLGNYPDDFSDGTNSVVDQKKKIDKYFANGYIDWKFEGTKNGGKNGNAGEELLHTFSMNALAKGQGIQVRTAGTHGWYYALRFRSGVTGTADITLNTFLAMGKDDKGNDVQKHSAWTETYIIESSELSNKKIEDLLDDDHKIKRFAPTVENPDAYLGNVTLEKGKEYIIVLRQTFALYQEAKKSAGTQNLYLEGLTVVAADPPPVEKTGYDFDLMGNYPDDFVGGKNSVMDQKKKIDQFYEKGYISWRVEAILNGSKTGDVEKEPAVTAFSQNALVKGKGLQAYGGAGHNWVYAFRIKSPGKGYHAVTMNSFLTQGKDAKGNAVSKHSIWADVYIIEASKVDNGKITLRDAMLKKYKLGNFEPTVKEPNAYIGTYNFEEGKEYIIIFRETMKHWQKVKNAGGTLNLYLEGFDIKFTGKPDYSGIDPNKTIYDFDLAHKENGIYTGSPKLDEKKADVSRLYGLEDLNWKLEENATGGSSKYSGLGITCYCGADNYLVFRIKSPGKGLHTLTLNHGRSGRAGTGAVYILPVSDLDNAYDATDIHNRVGRVNFYNGTGDVNPTSGYTTLLGTWDFGSASEYLVVIEAYAACPIDVATSYMYINQLVCEKGDVTSKYQTEKAVNSMLISDGPVNTVDVCPYLAAGEVNGHDYMYIPLEGKKMNVYDVDALEFVAQVDTPFTTCRGVVVDKDGIVWAVGDNPYIWRYDPFLNVAEDAYYYKGFEGGQKGSDKVIGGYSGQDIILGDDGALYFGVAMGGWFARYEPTTGKFTNLGTIGGDSANWSCSPVYYKGNLFGTVTGDRDGDGTKTTTLIKMEATTGDVIATMDLTPYLNQGEVMTRGGNVCGGVLLFGGDQNDKIKNVVAIDAETMEFIDLGIQGQISAGITNELDGKVYFTVQGGKGVFEFDGATRTATKLELSDAYSVPMRCHNNSFITVEGNNKFPGQSILSFRDGTLQPIILNPQTKEFMVIDGLVSDDHGTGNSIQSLTTGVTEADKNNLYIGVFNNQACSVLDIATGEISHKYETNGQTDSMCFYNGNLYVGNYNQGALVQINMDDKRRNVTLFSLKAEYHQARIHNVIAGDGKVFVGSIPDWYQYGGCLAWIDINTLEKHVERNVVQDQSVIGLAYHDGIIYGGTSRGGGTGATVPAGASAKVFLYDVENKQKIMELDPREFLKDMPETIACVSGLIPDPEVEKNGIIWGICGGTLFTIKYDKATGKVTTEEKLCYDKAEDGEGWKETGMQMVGNYLYVNMGDKGGVRKINVRNVEDNTLLPIASVNNFSVGADGNLYYAVTDDLFMYPMNVQQSDWDAADVVDKLFEAIPKVITLEHEAQLLEAEEAYNALTWTQKALIQKHYKLQDAKIEFLECRIDSIGDVTLDDAALILDIKETYNAMTTKDRSYVKNFRTVFVPAMQALQKLQDAEEAAKVQALIDTIPGMGEITLEKEPAIREIETAYNALTKDQRALVDATHLENALAVIKQLRQVRIDRLIELINGFGDNITLADEPVITEAMEIYDWLYMDERELVDYEKLILVNGKLQKLQKAAAAEVDVLIEAIGNTVGYGSGKVIKTARAAFDALTPGSQKYVKNIALLEEAESIFNAMFPLWAIIVIAVVAVGGAAAAAVVFIKKKKAAAPSGSDKTTEAEEAAVTDET